MEKCKTLKGNKEVTDLYMKSYHDYRIKYGYDKLENFSLNPYNQSNKNNSLLASIFCCV